jgi:hypothetical protein
VSGCNSSTAGKSTWREKSEWESEHECVVWKMIRVNGMEWKEVFICVYIHEREGIQMRREERRAASCLNI